MPNHDEDALEAADCAAGVDLANTPSKALREELERRRLAEHDARVNGRKQHHELIKDNVSTLLLFAAHQYSSCNDANPTNDDRHCARCVLLLAQKHPELLDENLEMVLDIQNAPIHVNVNSI